MVETIARERKGEIVQAIFRELQNMGGEARLKQVLESVAPKLNLTLYERATLEESGNIRWISLVQFYSIRCAKAGYLHKSDKKWYLTSEGTKALELSPEAFVFSVEEKYRDWKDTQISLNKSIGNSEKPESEGNEAQLISDIETRESIKMQALIAEIGSKMGMKIWIPRNNKAAIQRVWEGKTDTILDSLQLGYHKNILRIIEEIDVLWIQGFGIVRAFEVEHTTAIYSGILRMADLVAVLPNLDIKLHIVAPTTREDKVLREIQRPAFSNWSGGQSLNQRCTYISYNSLIEFSQLKHLTKLPHSVLDDYAKKATAQDEI